MLENEKYIGLHTNRGVTYDNIFPAIVSREVFDTVQKRILANKYGKHVPDIDYLLKGRVFCGYFSAATAVSPFIPQQALRPTARFGVTTNAAL